MRRSLLAPFGAILLLGLAAVTAAAAETTSPTATTTDAALPAACQADQTTAVTPSTTGATTATTPTATNADGEDLAVDDSDTHGHQMHACVDALQDLGEHGFGQIVSALAREEGRHEKSDDGATSTPTPTTATVTSAPQTGSTATTTVGTEPSENGKATHYGHGEDHAQGD